MSPQAREKRKCTWEIRRKLQREDVSRLYLQGITVPAAISDELSKKGIQISDKTVRRYLREVGTV